MGNIIFNQGFELDQFTESRLLDLKNQDERAYARKMMEQMFKEVAHYANDSYKELEKKIEHELFGIRKCIITTGIIEREKFDLSNKEMFPMCKEDLIESKIKTSDLLECLKSAKEFWVYSIFLQADYSIIKELWDRKKIFSCIIKTLEGEYKGSVFVKPQTKYNKALKELYEVFQINGITWHTVCAPYVNKMFDVYVDSADVLDCEEIEQIIIDFKEYTKYVKFHMVPTWNIEQVKVIADIQPEACIDELHYRHIINEKRLDVKSEYLVTNRNAQILEVNRGKNLTIVSTQQDVKSWILYRVVQKQSMQYDYIVMPNQSKEMKNQVPRTKGGIFEFINMLGYSEFVILNNILFLEDKVEEDSYPMEKFISDEIAIPKIGTYMLLEFGIKGSEDYLTRDIISYLITALQREFREYICLGKIV